MVDYRDPGAITFEATIEKPEGPGAYVEFPYSAFDSFGVRIRVPVLSCSMARFPIRDPWHRMEADMCSEYARTFRLSWARGPVIG